MLVEGKANSILTFFNKPSCYYIYIYIYTRYIYCCLEWFNNETRGITVFEVIEKSILWRRRRKISYKVERYNCIFF